MINFAESIETVISRELEQENNHLIKKICPLAQGRVSVKRARRKPGLKERTPLCNWTMPRQPDGYIRAGKYDLL
jgi:hypothetical protein